MDIGLTKNGVQFAAIAHFTDGPKHRFWAAYSYDGVHKQFKTKKAAIAWAIEREEQRTSTLSSKD